ncbi:MAG: hypothetical protein PSY12_07505 [bacterium]|nr:hypothetical protein [bacterium]
MKNPTLSKQSLHIWLLFGVIFGGFAWRMAWIGLKIFNGNLREDSASEAMNSALNFARTGNIANALGSTEGITAHLSPVMPFISGSIIYLTNFDKPLYTILLAIFAVTSAILCSLLVYHIFSVLEAPFQVRIAALALFCLLPIQPMLETVQFQYWEGALAGTLLAGFTLIIVRFDLEHKTGTRHLWILAVMAAITTFVSPAAGLAAYVACVIFAFRRIALSRWPVAILISALALCAVLMPWTIRNYRAFDQVIPLRANAGLEFALGNHPDAVNPSNPKATFLNRLRLIHPIASKAAFAQMKAMGGEKNYSDYLGKQAASWAQANPSDFILLCARHLRQFYFPPKWHWTIWGTPGSGTLIKQAFTWTVSALGLLGALLSIFYWRGRWLYVANMALIPALPYMIVQPVLRYRWIILLPLIFLSMMVLWQLWIWARARWHRKDQTMLENPKQTPFSAPSL